MYFDLGLRGTLCHAAGTVDATFRYCFARGDRPLEGCQVDRRKIDVIAGASVHFLAI